MGILSDIKEEVVRNYYRVGYRKEDGKWVLYSGNKPYRTYDKKSKAVKKGRKVAKNNKPSRLRVYKKSANVRGEALEHGLQDEFYYK